MRFLITGITGFVGSHLAEYLLSMDMAEVYGTARHRSPLDNISDIHDISLIKGIDLRDAHAAEEAIKQAEPEYIFHLAAQSFVPASWTSPSDTLETNVIGTVNLLEAVRRSELHPVIQIAGCYDEDTRAFTEDGLKEWKELKIEDKVLSLNPSNGNVEYKKIINIITDFDYSGDMLHFKSKSCNLLVTPNHKLLIKKNKKTKNVYFIRADEITGRNILPYGKYVSDRHPFNKDIYYLIGIFIGDGFISKWKKRLAWSGLSHEEVIKNRTKKGQFKQVEKKYEKEYSGDRVFLAIPHGDKAREKVEDALKRLNIKFSNNGENQIYLVPSDDILEVFRLCGSGAKNKTIPKFLLDSNTECLDELFKGLVDSDGHYRKTKNGKIRYGFTTTSKQLLNNMIELCYKLGKGLSFSERNKDSCINGRKIYGSKCYDISITNGEKILTATSKTNKARVFYNGIIWCVEVEDNHNLLIERKGKIAFCGNSSEEYGCPPMVEDTSHITFGINQTPRMVFKVPITEDFPLLPLSPYGVSKVAEDLLGFQYHKSYGMKIVRTRAFNHSGPRRGPEFVTSNFAKQIVEIEKGKREPVLHVGDLEARRDFTDVRDIVRGYWLAASRGKYGEVYNLCSGKARTIQSVLDTLRMQSTAQFEIVRDRERMRPSDIPVLEGDCTKFTKQTGWKPQVIFSQTMGDLLDYWRERI